jgi:DNA processing protein
MNFDKYEVALKLTKEGVGRKEILGEIYNRRFLNNRVEVEIYRKFLKKENIKIVSSNEKIYPKLLKQISDYPLILFTKGDQTLLNRQMITIVGTREMSRYGKWAVEYILRPLKNESVVVVSGLANGVDAQVHKTCLKFNIPTIGIVAGGIDKGYPKSNQPIYDEISSRGLLISEFPPGRKIIKGMFPMRNRILAGISSATIIIESDIRGGSLITMNLALEYGKDIFAIPCDIDKYSLQGCNMCISHGAIPLFLPEQLHEYCKNIDNY